MLNFITDNLGTIGVLAVLSAIVALAVYSLIKNKKEGKTSCGCSCGSCAMADKCHKKN